MEPLKTMRAEQEIFDELGALCASAGYVHVIAYLCARDNMIVYSGNMQTEDMQHLFSRDRLIRTETTTLVGLLLKHNIDFGVPSQPQMQSYVERTEALLEEMHHAMSALMLKGFDPATFSEKDFDPFSNGEALREPIFYSGESAYSFQYREFSQEKYHRDDQWLVANKGFTIREAREVVHSIALLQDEQTIAGFQRMRGSDPHTRTMLRGFQFSAQDVANRSQMELAIVEKILSAFTVPVGARNEQFRALHDFNIANATPLISAPDGTYLLFNIYSLVEALYEAPFYWMAADNRYFSTAMRNRGLFTEQLAVAHLSRVFGESKVLSNIDIVGPSGDKLGEIDVLVLFGSRALVLQAKSKRLTLEARRGNDRQIKDDFKKSVQDSCDQAYRCAALLKAGTYSLRDAAGKEIAHPANLKRTYVLCLVSDHYPALCFQSRQFLKFAPSTGISPPFVMDVFALDAMTEMLNSPLTLLSYIDRRTGYTDRLMASHELTILSYHLKQNLWLSDEFDTIMLDDDISADLDLAMLVRREGIPGKATPDGILTRSAGTAVGQMVKAIETNPDPATIDLGFMLLTLSEGTVDEINEGIEKIAHQALLDGKSHDLTIGIGQGNTGLTIHCNANPIDIAGPSLSQHCYARKYTQRADTWYGVCVQPTDKAIRFGLNLEFTWQQSDAMDELTKGMSKPRRLRSLIRGSAARMSKVGRNEPCPCGSGKKFKKCCGG